MNTIARTAGGVVGAGAASLAYASLIERNLFTLRHFTVPVLAPGTPPVRLLQVSDLHLTPGQRRKVTWVAALARLQPDLVVNTGDTFTSVASLPAALRALGPLAAFPAVFVPGNNDYYGPVLKSPHHYFIRKERDVVKKPLPWPELAAAMVSSGWQDLTHRRLALEVAGSRVALAGLDDPHLHKARYPLIAGRADAAAAVRIGVMHSPEPELLAQFAADGYDLVLAGHTHGGQVRVPFGPAFVTNCGIDVHRARWLHKWDERMYFHVCAGLGTNPNLPLRFACRPEASLLTLVPRA